MEEDLIPENERLRIEQIRELESEELEIEEVDNEVLSDEDMKKQPFSGFTKAEVQSLFQKHQLKRRSRETSSVTAKRSPADPEAHTSHKAPENPKMPEGEKDQELSRFEFEARSSKDGAWNIHVQKRSIRFFSLCSPARCRCAWMTFRSKIYRQFVTHSLHGTSRDLFDRLLFLLKSCKTIRLVEQIHSQVLVNSIPMPMPNSLLSKIIDLKDFNYSTLFFSRIPLPNSYAFNIMIRGFTTTWQRFNLALEFFNRMRFSGIKPDNFTYPFVFISCGNLFALKMGGAVHSEVVKSGLLSDFHVAHSLITMYSRCSELNYARNVFDEMEERDLVSWNSLISGYSRLGFAAEAMEMFEEMRKGGLEPDEMTLVSVLGACGDLSNLNLGRWIEEYVMARRMELNSFIGSALVNFYGKCGDLDSARRIFDSLKRKEVVIWNAMLTGYAQNGLSDAALSIFTVMKETGTKPNEITLIAVLTACASIGALEIGKQVDEYASKNGYQHNIYVATALVDMYAKCGNLDNASRVFESMAKKNEVSWNAMISAHAFHGRAKDSLSLFHHMLEEGKTVPDDITFVGVLSACVHSRMVDEGYRLFDLMSSKFGLTPKVEHYSCMVDLLSRAGRVYEAWDFIQKMPQKPDEILLGALLGACQKLKNVDIGERVMRLLLEIEPSNSGNYVISSKIYADMKRWDDSARMRFLMKQKGVTKTPGCSWIEMDGHLHEFHAGDLLVEDAQKIHLVLNILYEDLLMEIDTVDVELQIEYTNVISI